MFSRMPPNPRCMFSLECNKHSCFKYVDVLHQENRVRSPPLTPDWWKMMSNIAGSNLIPSALTCIRLDVRWYYPSLSSNPNRQVLV